MLRPSTNRAALVAGALCSTLTMTHTTFAADETKGPVFPTAAVAADHPLASRAGAEILRAGGNAVDAAVATSFALSVVRPYSCGIGGGGFMVIRLPAHPKHGAVETTINYREAGPAAVGPETFENDPDPYASTHGGKAVCVPGHVAGMLYALEKYGTMTREQVLAPAIRLAETGYDADQHYADSAHTDEMVIPWLKKDRARQERFAYLWERLLMRGEVKKGDTIKIPEQAGVLRLVAAHGRDGFYTGSVAEAIVRAVQRDGGALTLEDLAAYRPEERAPLRASFRGYDVLTMPPPSSGGIVLAQVLGMLEARTDDFSRISREHGHNSTPYIHFVSEAFKHAFADRARWMADPNFVHVPTRWLLDAAQTRARAAMIDETRTHGPAFYGTPGAPPEDGGTSHLCVVDAHGGAVACTETINLVFGSLLPVPEYGFILNNEMDDFLTRGGKANAFGLAHADLNRPEKGKRPLSSMTPTMVLRDGRVHLLAGASGGPRIISGTILAVLNVLVHDMDAATAVSLPRFHHQWEPNTLQMENALLGKQDVVEGLKALGHETGPRNPVAAVQIIRAAPGGGWQPASDPRKGGAPDGY
ncbi:MAG: gamma-glutamyltransferase [Phycisphaeraceae bacterium]|nr:gamma-glutamyltransferase [Phycisphaeraceae bacterium]